MLRAVTLCRAVFPVEAAISLSHKSKIGNKKSFRCGEIIEPTGK